VLAPARPLGFWASQQFFAPRALLIITWVGFSALLRGVGEIVLAFEVRRIGRDLSRQEAAQSDAGSRE
jgi:hypothetical protein